MVNAKRLVQLLLAIAAIQAGNAKSATPSFSENHSSSLSANARSCAECHLAPEIGGSSQVTVTRAGQVIKGKYVGVENGGILHKLDASSSRQTAPIRGLRVSLNLLGDAYIEAVPDAELVEIAGKQNEQSQGKIHGECVVATPLGKRSDVRILGRFGWKAQHSSVVDATADALRNELGIPNRLFPLESGDMAPKQSSAHQDLVHDELDSLVEFIRNSDPVAPDPERESAEWSQAGSKIFDQIGCSVCHVRTLKTAPPGTTMPGTNLVVSAKLGNKDIHPYSDYLLHDVGTGDGIVQSVRAEDYAAGSADKFRTAPLWGVRFRSWLMHDGKSVTYHQAIMRHGGEASDVVQSYVRLTPIQKEQLRLFLNSL